MLPFPDIDPVAIEIGPLQIRWYGLMYLVGFAIAWGLMRWRSRRGWQGWSHEAIDDLVFWGAIGLIVGARLGYVFFYQFGAWLQDPLMLVRIWEGGMSFHGGLIGVIAVMIWFARSRGRSILEVFDFVAPVTPLGLAAG
ncbi:MAG: prolipoprotein diacylglyceryl transferase, partial [Gammaproteobacteria bacterium]|nr:prolipoprotein diacylglyceryl transferase [Gammaproteobacteria bacterium]